MASNDNNAPDTGMVLVVAGAFILVMVLYAVAAFFIGVLTIVAFFAWNSPLTIFGHTIQPHEARAFVRNGVIGMIGLPIFVVFAKTLLSYHIPDEFFPHILILGYILGTVIGEALEEQTKAAEPSMREINPSIEDIQRLPQVSPPEEPFRFAQWDDEDAR